MRFRTIVVAVFFALIVIAVTPFLVFCLLTGLREPLIIIGRWAVGVGRRILGIKVEASGLERIRPGSAHIFMANHVSFLDGPLVMTSIPGVPRAILKTSILRIPIVGQAMRHVGFIPVDRKGAEGGKKSIARAAALMRDRGYSFLIFPEGTRSIDGKLQAFRRGGFFLALESGASVVPVAIRGTFELMPKGQKYARSGTVRVEFLDPLPVSGYTVETMGGLMEKVREAILTNARGSEPWIKSEG